MDNELCSCGSGEYKEALYDARGIFCCYYCSKCEIEKRNRYRQDIFENSNYECNEQIEADDPVGLEAFWEL